MDYTTRIKKARKPVYEDVDTTPLMLPVTGAVDTTTQTIEKILLASGAINREQWDKLKGYEYDIDIDNDGYPIDDSDFDESDDEFIQSKFAAYEAAVTDSEVGEPEPVASASETSSQVESEGTAPQETKKRGRPKKQEEEVELNNEEE
ncbi:hypothetical protein [Dipodfec virus UOA04_Rod_985]|nr:hypothetical protein [Dipodfec virus UOA04_Rod_985]